jgi:ATP-binding cassette subfamily B protein
MNALNIKEFDLKETLSPNRFTGLWRLMRGYRTRYFAATLFLGISAFSKTGMFLLVQYLIDDVLAVQRLSVLPWVAAGFLGLALSEGMFTFLSGRLAAQTAEGIAFRLRNFIYDHIQRLSFC